MTTENKAQHSPLPWRVTAIGDTVLDRYGKYIATCFCEDEKEPHVIDCANAALVADAVNEREKLRGLVRKMLPCVERVRDGVHSVAVMNGEPPEDNPRLCELTQIIIDATAVLGEEADDGQE